MCGVEAVCVVEAAGAVEAVGAVEAAGATGDGVPVTSDPPEIRPYWLARPTS